MSLLNHFEATFPANSFFCAVFYRCLITFILCFIHCFLFWQLFSESLVQESYLLFIAWNYNPVFNRTKLQNRRKVEKQKLYTFWKCCPNCSWRKPENRNFHFHFSVKISFIELYIFISYFYVCRIIFNVFYVLQLKLIKKM